MASLVVLTDTDAFLYIRIVAFIEKATGRGMIKNTFGPGPFTQANQVSVLLGRKSLWRGFVMLGHHVNTQFAIFT